MRRPALSKLLATALVFAGAAPSCDDPVHDDLISSLGPERPGVAQGQYHRAGQPCIACHGPQGPASTEYSVAGTIFWQPSGQSEIGVDGAVVSVIDSVGATAQTTTNCVGNFWFKPGNYSPSFPILVSVYKDGQTFTQSMFTQISRAGSCATCHQEPGPAFNSVGQIYMTNGAIPPGEVSTTCPVDPNVANLSGGTTFQ